MLGTAGVTEANMMQYLGIIEQVPPPPLTPMAGVVLVCALERIMLFRNNVPRASESRREPFSRFDA